MFPRSKLEVTPGFVLLTAWFALVNGGGVLMLVLGASTVHELGHWLVLRLLGARIQAFRLTALGAELTANSGRLSYGGELLAVLAGPGANLAAALFTSLTVPDRWPEFIGVNLILACFNLLPIRPLDGGRAVKLAATWLAGPGAGDVAARVVSGLTSSILAVLLACVIYQTHGSLWLLPPLFAAAGMALSELHPRKMVYSF